MSCPCPSSILPVPSLPGYHADDLGNIWSGQSSDPSRLRRLRGYRRKDGYVADGPRLAHRLVLEAFAGPCPAGLEARHLENGERRDNRPANLAWGTRREQAADRRRHGTARTKLNETKVSMIRTSTRAEGSHRRPSDACSG